MLSATFVPDVKMLTYEAGSYVCPQLSFHAFFFFLPDLNVED